MILYLPLPLIIIIIVIIIIIIINQSINHQFNPSTYTKSLNSSLHFIRNIQLVGIEQNQNTISTISEIVNDLSEVIGTVQTLLLTRQHSRSIDEGNAVKDRRRDLNNLEAVEEARSELLKALEGEIRRDGGSVTGDHTLGVSIHDGDELIGSRLRSHTHTLVIALQQIADERGLTDGVLTNQKDHGLSLEVVVVHQSLVELIVHVSLLNGHHLLGVATG